MPKKLSQTEILRIAQESIMGDSLDGICLSCGNIQDGCEPDADNYECEACGESRVCGGESLLFNCF